MKEKGQIYVDGEEGVNSWIGCFCCCKPGFFGISNDVWSWQLVNKSSFYNFKDTNNYWNKRLATKEEIEEIKKLFLNLGYILKEDNTLEYHPTLETAIKN